jgi:hypothetical protein
MFRCKECKSKEDETKWTDGKDLLLKKLCFDCNYWMERVERVGGLTQVIVDGSVYQIGREDAVGMRGFDGDKFIIKFKDGRLVHSTNLWFNGRVPKKYKDRLIDNADFIKEKFI